MTSAPSEVGNHFPAISTVPPSSDYNPERPEAPPETSGTLSQRSGAISEASGALSEGSGALSEGSETVSEGSGPIPEVCETGPEAAGTVPERSRTGGRVPQAADIGEDEEGSRPSAVRYAGRMMKYSITATVLIILSLVLLGFVRQGTTPKWEYKTEVYSLIDVDWEPNPQIVKEERIEARAHRESVSKLASLGSSGWELVNLTPVAIAHELSTKQDFQTNEPLKSRLGLYRATFKRLRP